MRNKIIKAIGDPKVRFEEDSLRILRAIRFQCRYNFKIDRKTEKAMFECAPLLKNISKERCKQELLEIFKGHTKQYSINKYLPIINVLLPLTKVDKKINKLTDPYFVLAYALSKTSGYNLKSLKFSKKEIDYINATEVVVRVAPRTSNHGDMVENGGEVVFKVGYSKTIEFNLKDNYEFIGWAAKDRSSKKEYTDAVEFIPLSEKSSKTQKVTATLLKKVDNLQIMPVCKVINDTVAPEISSDYNFALTPEQLGKQNDMLKKTYSSWNNADYKSHHTKSVWLDFKITESDFEAAENYFLYVEEILLKDINGNSPNSITEFKKAGLFTETDTDGTFEIKYEYPFTSGGNGIVQLNIYAMDSEENKSSRITCFVLKDTNIFSTIEMKLTNPEWNTYKQISQNVDKLSFTIKNCFDEYYTCHKR